MGLNNVNMEKLGETVAEFQADLGKARRTFKVEGLMSLDPGGPQFTARLPIPGGDFVLESDPHSGTRRRRGGIPVKRHRP